MKKTRLAAFAVAALLSLALSGWASANAYIPADPSQFRVKVYRHMGTFPFLGTQEEACQQFGTPCPPLPLWQDSHCRRVYVENGSYLYQMNDTVYGINKVNEPDSFIYEMQLPEGDGWASMCPYTSNGGQPTGWSLLRFDGCGNYVYTPTSWLYLREQAALPGPPTVLYQPLPEEQPRHVNYAPAAQWGGSGSIMIGGIPVAIPGGGGTNVSLVGGNSSATAIGTGVAATASAATAVSFSGAFSGGGVSTRR